MSERRYVLRAMTLEEAHAHGFSTGWFEERAATRDGLVIAVASILRLAAEEPKLTPHDIADNLLRIVVAWP